jgi:hypothetical protein
MDPVFDRATTPGGKDGLEPLKDAFHKLKGVYEMGSWPMRLRKIMPLRRTIDLIRVFRWRSAGSIPKPETGTAPQPQSNRFEMRPLRTPPLHKR